MNSMPPPPRPKPEIPYDPLISGVPEIMVDQYAVFTAKYIVEEMDKPRRVYLELPKNAGGIWIECKTTQIGDMFKLERIIYKR